MKKSIKLKLNKIIIFFMLFLIPMLLFGCKTENYANVLDENQYSDQFFSEEQLSNMLLPSDILKDKELLEYVIDVEKLIEKELDDGIVLEDVQIDIISVTDMEMIFDEHFNGAAAEYDIDWGKIIGKFAVGTAVIVVTGVISCVSADIPGVGYVFACSFKSALKEAVIGAAVGGAINSIISYLKNGKKIPELAKYAIEGAADGFMWGAISGALMGAFSGYTKYYKNTNYVFDGNKLIGEINKKGEIIHNGTIVGYKTQNGFVTDTAGKILGFTDDAGNIGRDFTSLIPTDGKIMNYSTKTVKYTINASQQVATSSGKIVGTINEAGQIIDDLGYFIGQVDDAGRLVTGINKTINAGFKLYPSGQIANATRVVNGVTQYLDDANNIIGIVSKVAKDGETINYILKPVSISSVKVIGQVPSNGLQKLVGQVDDAGNIVLNWDRYFQVERSKAVRLAWAAEKELVSKPPHRGTRDWTADEIVELLTTGKVNGYEGHHINSALYSPSLAGEPNNIIFYSKAEHLSIGHGGNYQNVTFGELLSRIIP